MISVMSADKPKQAGFNMEAMTMTLTDASAAQMKVIGMI
jgi:hypothetical protein